MAKDRTETVELVEVQDDGAFVKYFKICGMKEKEVKNSLKDLLGLKNPRGLSI